MSTSTRTSPQPPTAHKLQVVLDTQVVMDWLVFAEPSINPLITQIEGGRLLWLATVAMQAELLHVLGRGVAASRRPDTARIEAVFSRYCRMIPAPELGLSRPRCSDPDDQKFIDLGLSLAAQGTTPTWLISRDRAVLAVAKRARRLGLEILTPAAWLKLQPGISP